MTNAELFDEFFKRYVEEKFAGVDMTHPNIQKMKEILRAGFRGACVVKDEEVKAQKIETAKRDTEILILQQEKEEMSSKHDRMFKKLVKGLKFYEDQKGFNFFEQDGSKKRTLGTRATEVLEDYVKECINK